MLFKKYFLRQSIKNKEVRIKNLKAISFLIDNLPIYDEGSEDRCFSYLLNEKYKNIFIDSIHINRVLKNLVKQGDLIENCDGFSRNYKDVTALYISHYGDREKVFEIYSKIEGFKFLPNVITRFVFEKPKSSVVIFSNTSRYDSYIYQSRYLMIVIINFLKDVKKLYDFGLSLSNVSGIDIFGYFKKYRDNVSILSNISLKTNEETFEEFAKTFLISYFDTLSFMCFNKKIEDCNMPYEHSTILTKAMFDALKSADVSDIDFFALMIDMYTKIDFGSSFFDPHISFNKDYIISPSLFKIKTADEEIKSNLSKEDREKLHRLSCYVYELEETMGGIHLLYDKLRSRYFNSNMEFVTVETRPLNEATKVEFCKNQDIDEVRVHLAATIELWKSNIANNTQFGFGRNIDIYNDLYTVNYNNSYLLKDISLFTLDKNKLKDYEVICIFILQCIKELADYTIEDGSVKYKSCTLVNYLPLEVMKFVEKYFINPEFIEDSDIDYFDKIKELAASLTNYEFSNYPQILNENLSYFLQDKTYVESEVEYKDVFYELSATDIRKFYQSNLLFNKVKILVYNSYKKNGLKGYVRAFPVNGIPLFSKEFFMEYDEKEVIKVLINLNNNFPTNTRYSGEIKNLIFKEFEKDFVVDECLNVHNKNILKNSLGMNKEQFAELVKIVIETSREYKNSGNPGSTFDFAEWNLEAKHNKNYLTEVHSDLTKKHERLNIWYNGNDADLFNFLYPSDYMIYMKCFTKIIYKCEFYTIYKNNEEKFLYVFDKNSININSLAIISRNDASFKIARENTEFEIIGIITNNLIRSYNSTNNKLDELYNLNLNKLSNNIKLLIVISKLINEIHICEKENHILFSTLAANLEFKNWDISTFFGCEDTEVYIKKLSYVHFKDNPYYTKYRNMKNLLLVVEEKFASIVGKIMQNDTFKTYFKYCFEKNKLTSLYLTDLNVVQDLFMQSYIDSIDNYCEEHKIYFNSRIYEDCPICNPNGVNYLTVDINSFGENMKKGGEALIFEASHDTLYKIYRKKSSGEYIVNLSKKRSIINSWLNQKERVEFETKNEEFSIILPEKLLKDKEEKKFCGLSMKKVKDAKPISVLMDIEYAQKFKWTYIDVLKVLINLGKAIEYLGKNGWYIGDFNGGNILFDKNYHVYVIDTDSLGGIALNEPIAFVESFLDPNAYINGDVKTNITTDYYSYAIIAFSALTGIHPFGGIYRKNNKIIPQIFRMKNGISILGNHNVKVPDTIFKWDWMSENLKSKFLSIFEGKNRESILKDLQDELSKTDKVECKNDIPEISSNNEKLVVIKDAVKSDITKLENIFDISQASDVTKILSAITVLVKDHKTFYHIFQKQRINLSSSINNEEKIIDVWYTSDDLYYFALTDKKIYFISAIENKVIKNMIIDDYTNVKHSDSGNKIFFMDKTKKLKTIKYRKKAKDLKFTNKATINKYLEGKGEILDFYISKEASVIAFYVSKVTHSSDEIFFFDLDRNECITSLSIPNSHFDFQNVFNLKIHFDYSGEDNALITFNKDEVIYFTYGQYIGKFSINKDKTKLDIEYDLDEKITLYKGILFYPLDLYIGAINLSTKNKKYFECKVCTKHSKICRFTNGFEIIDNMNFKMYKFFI